MHGADSIHDKIAQVPPHVSVISAANPDDGGIDVNFIGWMCKFGGKKCLLAASSWFSNIFLI